MARPGGLGKGLGALIPSGAAEHAAAGLATGPGLQELPIAAIRPNPYQPRDRFDEEALGALADSIREVGLLQPVLVRPAGDGFELIAGERRWRAARRAGLAGDPGDRARDRGSARARAGPGREPAARRPEPPGGGRGLSADDRGLLDDARAGRVDGREEPRRGDEHRPTAPAATVDSARPARRAAVDGTRPRAPRDTGPRSKRRWPAERSRTTCRCGQWRRPSGPATTARTPTASVR